MNKIEREEREFKSLYTDERYAKKAWKELIGASLQSTAANLTDVVDARGNVSIQSVIYREALHNVKQRLVEQGLSREPMKAEVLVEANVIRGAFDNNVFNILLDRTAGKVKEEVSITAGAFEELSDEQLEILAEHEKQKKLESSKVDSNDNS